MKKMRFFVLVSVLFLMVASVEAENICFSPLTAVAVGPAGPPSDLIVSPYCCPSTAIKVTASKPVTEDSFQWVLVGLVAQEKKVIRAVQVCYEVNTKQPGSTYISQVRLTQTTTPDSALVIHDDPTNLTSTDPVCYTSYVKLPKPRVGGDITLELKMVIGNQGDEIRVGGIKLLY
jgi:hypothetical protein